MTDTATGDTPPSAGSPAGSAEPTDYKATVLLPRTDYPMKAGLERLEVALQARWNQEDVYGQIRKAREGAPKFVLHDGPPYATGDLHVGTGLNKVLKDFVVRYRTMRGYDSPYRPGWDCHGLPIESKVMKELGAKARTTPTPELRRLCHDYAMKFFARNREDFCRLGIMGAWGEPYLTVDPAYEAGILDVFADMVERGYIYRALRPIHWCLEDETALAEAELEYGPHTSPSITVRFPLVDDVGDLFAERDPAVGVDLLIWTTTPWTLPANVAIAAHPEHPYALVSYCEGASGRLRQAVMAAALVEANMAKAGVSQYRELGRVPGRALEGRRYRHVLLDRVSPVVLADYVTIEGEGRGIDESQIVGGPTETLDSWSGTGLVHTAPGHGRDDFVTGRKYALATISPLDSRGRFTAECGVPELVGQGVFAANPAVVDMLKSRDVLMFSEPYRHQYAHCWRCRKPVIFRATEQWFVGVDHDGLRERMGRAISEEVRWFPATGANRIGSMIQRRPDWCISRQRHWGVAIPAFFNRHTGQGLIRADVVRHVRDLFARHGSGVWFEKSVAELLPPDFREGPHTAADYDKDHAIFDVWFESGASHRSVLRADAKLGLPAAVYLEGSDQHRGWFQVSLITAMAADGCPPYRNVVTHGFIVDDKGEKMSKSLGNFVSVADAIKLGGADLFRLWVSSVDFTREVHTSPELMRRVHDPYRTYRNTLRVLLGNLAGFEPARHTTPKAAMTEIDRWLLGRLAALVNECRAAYDDYQFYKVYSRVMSFCGSELSSFYVDVLKDRMYCEAQDAPSRRATQTVMHKTADTLIRLMAPILVHTSEEAWGYLLKLGPLAGCGAMPASVHLALMPDTTGDAWLGDDGAHEPALAKRWETLLSVRGQVNRELDKLRKAKVLGKSVEAEVDLWVSDGQLEASLREAGAELLALVLMVSCVRVMAAPESPADATQTEVPGLRVAVRRGHAPECRRCWNLRPDVGVRPEYPDLCGRCAQVVIKSQTAAS